MIVKSLYFLSVFILPYAAEQWAYTRLIPKTDSTNKTVSQAYGWRFVWDLSYFIVIMGAGYRFIGADLPWGYLQWLGYVLFLSGIILRILSLKELGRYYDPGIALRADHQLIRSGPYRFLRHPLHLGTVLQITGLALFCPAWAAIPVIAASLALCLYLNRTEDKLHLQRFDSSFRDYYFHTWDIADLIFWKQNRG